MNKMPIFLFLGLLESGKTAFINQMVNKKEFKDGKSTVILVCEEGIEEYDEAELAKNNTHVVLVEDEEEISTQLLRNIKKKYNPDRVLIEYNGMWNIEKLFKISYPVGWFYFQILTFVNLETFGVYINNMRSIMMEQIKIADLVIFNREQYDTDDRTMLGTAKAANPQAKVFTCDKNFVLEQVKDIMPFDISGPVIEVTPENYGIWYLDLWETKENYDGKVVKVKGLYFRDPADPPTEFAFGRFAMTCCEDDIGLMGLYCQSVLPTVFEPKTSVAIEAKIVYEKSEAYDGDEGPVLHVTHIKKIDENQEELVTFN